MNREEDIEHHREAIKNLYRMRSRGEVSKEECEKQSVEHAMRIAELGGIAEPESRPTPDLNASILHVVEMAEANTAVVHAIAVGIVAAVSHYVRSRPKEG